MGGDGYYDIVYNFAGADDPYYGDLIDVSDIDADDEENGNDAFDFVGEVFGFGGLDPGELAFFYEDENTSPTGNDGTWILGNTDEDSNLEIAIWVDGVTEDFTAADFVL